jgi:heptosyltransferase-2
MAFSGDRTIKRSEIKTILIRATNWVGDGVMTLPALEAVRECFPKSTLVVLARPWVVPLFENHPMIDKVMSLGKSSGYLRNAAAILKTVLQIRKGSFDLAILFQNAFEAALIAYLGGVKHRVGYDTDHRRFLLSHPVVRDKDKIHKHQVEYYLSLVRTMGCDTKVKNPQLFASGDHREKMCSLLSEKGVGRSDFVLGLGPGAVYGPAKRWPAERFAAIGDMAVERWGARIIILGSNKEKDICTRVSGTMNQPCIDLCGRVSLGEAVALVGRCNLFLSNDSGLMHIASALNIPLVAIFGSTDPFATGPRGAEARVVRHQVDCAPCMLPVCPKDFRCMLGIETQEVWKELMDLKSEKEVR